MKKILALLISVLMIVSCFSIIASAEAAAAPVIVDGTANSTGAVIRNQSKEAHAVPAVCVPDGSTWVKSGSDYRTPENLWVYGDAGDNIEQLDRGYVEGSNNFFPTLKVNQADGTVSEILVYGSRAKLAAPTQLSKFEVIFDTASNNAKNWLINFGDGTKLYASVDGETWDELYAFKSGTAFTVSKDIKGVQTVPVESDKFYNYVAIYTSKDNAGLCRLMTIIPYGTTKSNELPVDVVTNYGQDTTSTRTWADQENIWENDSHTQFQGDNFTTYHNLTLTDGTTATGFGAAAKLDRPSTLDYFLIKRQNNANKRAYSNWSGMTFYGSTDGGSTWTVIANGTPVYSLNQNSGTMTTQHSFEVKEEYKNTAFTDVAMLITDIQNGRFHIQRIVPYGAPAFAPEGEVLDNMTTIDDGTRWIRKNDDVNRYREPSDIWEKTNKVFQFHRDNTFSVGAMGLGAAAKLEYPTKLTGFKIDLDMTAGKEFWKARVNHLSVYASVDGEEWVKLHSISGVDQDINDTSYVITVDDDTLYNYVGIYTTRPDLGIRFKNIAAYGKAEDETMTLRGYQMKRYTDEKGVDRTAVRFVATVDEMALENRTLGFDIVASYVKAGVAGQQTFDVTTKYVYEKIIANGKELTMDDIAAGSGHEYIVLGTVMDINRANYDYVTFTVTPYVINAEGVKLSSAPVVVTTTTGYPYADWTINGNSISKYTIVYDSDGVMKSTIEAFRDKLADLSGYTLPIKTADRVATKYEILIGETGRAATSSVTRPLALNYTIATSGNKLVVRTGGEHSLELLMADFFGVVKCGAGEALTMGADYTLDGNYYDDPYENTTMVDGAEIRIMSANVLHHSYTGYSYDSVYPELDTTNGGTFTFERRVEIFMASLDYYNPTVVGVQEFPIAWNKAVQAYIDSADGHYSNWTIKVFTPDSAPAGAYSGIIYRNDMLTIGESGIIDYTERNNNFGQKIAWADFTVTSTNEKFSFVSTHWGNGTTDNQSEIQQVQAEELAAFVNGKKEAGMYTVFTTGDFNANIQSTTFNSFIDGSGSFDAMTKAIADGKNINNTGSWHEWGGTTNSAGTIDHITATNNCTVLSYETVFYNQQIYGSDHSWVVADLTIGG